MKNPQTYIGVPALDVSSLRQYSQEASFYDYVALIPTLLVAATPLILSLRKKKSSAPDKADNKDNE